MPAHRAGEEPARFLLAKRVSHGSTQKNTEDGPYLVMAVI